MSLEGLDEGHEEDGVGAVVQEAVKHVRRRPRTSVQHRHHRRVARLPQTGWGRLKSRYWGMAEKHIFSHFLSIIKMKSHDVTFCREKLNQNFSVGLVEEKVLR